MFPLSALTIDTIVDHRYYRIDHRYCRISGVDSYALESDIIDITRDLCCKHYKLTSKSVRTHRSLQFQQEQEQVHC
jgi:hypothetical protein